VAEILEEIVSVESRPPRQIDERIPKELDRICLKALSKRASERYSTARDMADDLRHFLVGQAPFQQSGEGTGAAAAPGGGCAGRLRPRRRAVGEGPGPDCERPRWRPCGLPRNLDGFPAPGA
jgi:hypothetical protein